MKINNRNKCKIISYNNAFENDDDKLRVKLKVQHDNENSNRSSFSLDSIINAKPSLVNRPIVAYLVYNEDGTQVEDFAGHEIDFVKGKWVYKEQIIGVVPETMNYSIETDENGLSYPIVDGIIFKSYSNGAWKLIEDEDWDISMEIQVNDCFSRNDGITEITDFSYRGLTVLGRNFTPAMVDANISSYSKEDYESTINKFNELLKEKEENVLDNLEQLESPIVDETTVETRDIAEISQVEEQMVEPTDIVEEDVNEEINNEFEQLKVDYELVAKTLNELKTSYAELEEKLNAMNDYDTLKEFKKRYDDAQYEAEIKEISAKFDLEVEEYQELEEKALKGELAKEQYEKELYCLIGMKQLQEKENFSQIEKPTSEVKVQNNKKTSPRYGELGKKYSK